MRNDLLSGSPREIVEKAIFLRVSGYSDDDLLALALFEARRRNGASASEALERATQLYVAKLRQVAAWVGLQGAGNGP